jgi:hypothetical protein
VEVSVARDGKPPQQRCRKGRPALRHGRVRSGLAVVRIVP